MEVSTQSRKNIDGNNAMYQLSQPEISKRTYALQRAGLTLKHAQELALMTVEAELGCVLGNPEINDEYLMLK